MSINNSLEDIQSPVQNRHGEKSSTSFLDHLNSIEVRLLSAPSTKDLEEYIPRWCSATWSDIPHNEFTPEERSEIIQDMFDGKLLPSAQETINLVFLVSNIDLVDVTHLLRHRTMSFSAVCSADRDMRQDSCLVKSSIKESRYFYKYMEIVKEAKQLYADMVDTDEISILDARTILPRSLEHHYYCRVNFRDMLNFIRQRIDRQIQPESDNIVALKMWIEIVKIYPQASRLIDVNKPDDWYIKTAPTGRSSNIYMPELPRNDVFDYKKQWFMYEKQRSEMIGGNTFISLWKKLVEELKDASKTSD